MDKGGRVRAIFSFMSKMIYSMTDSESSFPGKSEMQLSAIGQNEYSESSFAAI